jgi:hypothetical protein
MRENQAMQLDVRLPIGVMFVIIGLLLTVYGLFTWSDAAMYQRSLGYNVNFWWGLFLTAFGAVMLFLARRAGAGTARASGRQMKG